MERTTRKAVKQQAAASTGKKKAIEPAPMRLSRTLSSLLAKPDKKNFRWWYELGNELLKVHPEPKAGQKKRPYRPHIIEKLALQLNGVSLKNEKTIESAKTTLWQARKLVMRFGTWKKLVKFRGKLSIWHVMTLVAVDKQKGNKSSMEDIHKRCVAENWSVDQLKREVRNDKGGKTGSGRQPKPLMAATPAMAVEDLYIAARRWMA
jgi:hypothetical protein